MRTTPESVELRRKYTALMEEARETEGRLERARDAADDIARRFPDDKERLDQARADVAYLSDHHLNLKDQAEIMWRAWEKESGFKGE